MSPERTRQNEDAARTENAAIAQSILALTGTRPRDCPDLEDIVAWHERKLDAAHAERVATHVAHCDRCFALWRELSAVVAPAPAPAAASHGWLTRLWMAFAAALRQPAMLGAVAASMAMVAVLGIYVTSRTPGIGGPPLPGYELQLQGRALMRGAEPAAGADTLVAFAPGTRFELLLRPESAVQEDVAVRVWVDDAGSLRELDGAAATIARGVVTLEGEIGRDWQLPEGASDLVIVVGRSGALPDAAAVTRELGNDRHVATDEWAAWRVPVSFAD